jgi:integrase
VIIRTRGGLPYSEDTFQEVWRDVRKAAGIPKEIWNRDLRASGSTEARAAGAPIDDVKKLMGHTARSETTAEVYDRAKLEAHRRIVASPPGACGALEPVISVT